MPPASGQCAQLYLKLPGAKPLSALALSHRPGGRVLLASEPWLAQLPPPPPVVLGPSLSVPEWPGPSWEQHQAVSLLAQLPPPVGGLAGGTGPHSPGSDQDARPVTPCVWGREGVGTLGPLLGSASAECQSRAFPGANPWPGALRAPGGDAATRVAGFSAARGGGADGQWATLLERRRVLTSRALPREVLRQAPREGCPALLRAGGRGACSPGSPSPWQGDSSQSEEGAGVTSGVCPPAGRRGWTAGL